MRWEVHAHCVHRPTHHVARSNTTLRIRRLEINQQKRGSKAEKHILWYKRFAFGYKDRLNILIQV